MVPARGFERAVGSPKFRDSKSSFERSLSFLS
jgi:hypothetical protein